MSAEADRLDRIDNDYLAQAADLEDRMLHVNSLKSTLEPHSPGWREYQDTINTLNTRARVLKAIRPQLEDYDRRIANAHRDATRARNRANGIMDFAWKAVQGFGGLGLIGLLFSVGLPTEWWPWLPVVTTLFLVIAAAAMVMALRSRPRLYAEVDHAVEREDQLGLEKQQLLAQAEHQIDGMIVPEMREPFELSVGDRAPLALVPPSEDDDDDET